MDWFLHNNSTRHKELKLKRETSGVCQSMSVVLVALLLTFNKFSIGNILSWHHKELLICFNEDCLESRDEWANRRKKRTKTKREKKTPIE